MKIICKKYTQGPEPQVRKAQRHQEAEPQVPKVQRHQKVHSRSPIK